MEHFCKFVQYLFSIGTYHFSFQEVKNSIDKSKTLTKIGVQEYLEQEGQSGRWSNYCAYALYSLGLDLNLELFHLQVLTDDYMMHIMNL